MIKVCLLNMVIIFEGVLLSEYNNEMEIVLSSGDSLKIIE